ncbi:helix-turn-helix domain-containing protein [Frankia sp. CcWB3]
MGQFPAGLSEILTAEFDALGEEIIAAIAREVPAYARPLEGKFGHEVRRGVDEALFRFLSLVEAGPHCTLDLAASREVYVRLGRGEVYAGRSLDNLLSAYRVGARVSWRRLGEAAARRGGLDGPALVSLAEMMFAYIDGISAASAEGYASEQYTAAGELERLWDRLGEMLLSGATGGAIAQVARSGSVRLPGRLAAVLVPAPTGSAATHPAGHPGTHPADSEGNHEADPWAGSLPSRLPSGCPRAVQGGDIWMFVGSTERAATRAALARQLAGLAAVVGPAVPWGQAAASAARARFACDARSAGRLRGIAAADPLFTDEHLSALLLASDPGLITDLASRRLAPLDGLPCRTRERLAETLLHWLTLRGQRGLIAERLHIHPQTVRYRVNQLRELFGPCLEDPDTRFDLELVLRAGAAEDVATDPVSAAVREDTDEGRGPGSRRLAAVRGRSPGP